MTVLGLAWGLGILERAGDEGISCVRAWCLVSSDPAQALCSHALSDCHLQ